MELKNLSSNWKELQKTLQKDSTQPSKRNSTPLKRKKSSHEQHTASNQNGVKRSNPFSASLHPYKKRKMDTAPASEPASKSLSQPSTTLLDEDTNPVSILTPSALHPDAPNAGLSPTATAGKYIALDCEMVGFGPTPDLDSQLARVSLVNYHGHQLYDSYVLPVVPVTDYRTHVSGITPSLLSPSAGARPFAAVQREVATLLLDRVLVGHALKHDLAVLMVTHPERDIRDTARFSEFRKLSAGRTPALRKLAREVLGVRIQEGMHSSVEDARAAMALFRREKEAFEREVIRRWGRPRVVEVKGEEEGEGKKEGAKKKKKKKKKKKGKK